MAILIDPPLWPAHGTLFSHLVSDTSIEELHAFARTAGLPERAFDRDHYDVPQRRQATLVAAGALPVSASELVRRLLRSGLRIPARERPERLDAVLLARWEVLLPGAPQLGRDLLTRWSEEHRSYHDRAHLLAVLAAIDRLVSAGEPSGAHPRAVVLAAWFHDAVYAGVPGGDEEASAALAAALLPGAGIGGPECAEVIRLVRLTATHRPMAADAAGALLCDADLEVLGRSTGAYARYAQSVHREYAHVPEAIFRDGRARILSALLESGSLYSTPTGAALWEGSARANLTAEITALRSAG
ncbi:DUF4031 domain-containing protein [Paeniglutamicibacter cryotolerans]|uniref:Putative metal-dependent HD superfamily phosphohydrolase n=1 Tax=Paeniglutamicibacter cryotolerans TaxID=670079 RepID=A0A839QN30_9MICC|nr:DUF4031 domain-containing protein [Paeniglutamicibacter cryotolerans]MBB2995406.1 putative metal-dependent HD superfamily phosphohydrolase [Paeniglutamicibacter cryotolerans]